MIKIPKGLEKFEKILTKYTLKEALGMTYKGINSPIDFRKEASSFAAIAYFNNEMELYDKFIILMEKYVGKYGKSTIMKLAVDNDMGVDIVAGFWSSRNVHFSHNFITSLKDCDEKYIRFFLSTDKLIRLSKRELLDSTVRAWIKADGMRLLEIGQEYPKFAKVMLKAYDETGDDMYLPSDVKEMFLF